MTEEILAQIKASKSFQSLSPEEQEVFLKTLENADEATLKESVAEMLDNDYLATLNESQLLEEVKKREGDLRIQESKLSRANLKITEEIDREGEQSVLDNIEDQLDNV